MKFFQMTPQKAAEHLNTSVSGGLRIQQIQQKQEICGKNELRQARSSSMISRFLSQLKDYMIVILIVASTVSAVAAIIGKDSAGLINAFVIVGVVLVNAVIGMLQEGRAAKTLHSLERLTASKARVIRNNKEVLVDAFELVPGDILLLEEGDLVPADGRIAECSSFKVDETALTGNDIPSDKNIDVIEGDNHSPADLVNMVFSGTLVVSGSAKVIVTAIGMETQIGKIAGMLSYDKNEKTPLQIQLAQMGKVLGLVTAAVCALIFLLGVVQQRNIIDMFLTAVSLAVAAIPEGMVATVTIILALGVLRLAKENAVVRKLSVVESLGCVDVICTDKTGTLTKNEMTVSACFAGGEIYSFVKDNYRNVAEVIFYGSMCNDAYFENGVCIGDPTEGAIVAALETMGKNRALFDSEYPKMGRIPFDNERKCKSTIHVVEGRNLVVVKGSPDSIWNKCINTQDVEIAQKAADIMAAGALRVLAVAVKEIDEIPPELMAQEIECELTLVGLVGLIDQPRKETVQGISFCKSAGIRTAMITGDHVITAQAMAKRMGIFREGDVALCGSDIEEMSQEKLEEAVDSCSVYARVTPQHKVRIIEAWQAKGKIVAMTGDGVHDAPALQNADIGCAMGIDGTDAAKSAADMVLMDNNFVTIVAAIQQGRGIYNNIKKTLRFLLSGNLGEVLVILGAMLFLLPMPLLPLHLLWINVVTDTLPALALNMEVARSGLMKRPPRDKKENLITKDMTIAIFLQGLLIAAVSLFAFVIGTGFSLRTDDAFLISQGQTMAFSVLSFSQLFHAFDSRSRHSIVKVKPFGNKYLNVAALISTALILFVMLTPGVMTIFGTVALSAAQWFTVIGLSLIPFVLCEVFKFIRKSDGKGLYS